MKMFKRAAVAIGAAFSIMLALGVTAAPAQAQATRTWVSGVGDDVNPCSRTAPCKTFAGAISKTAAGGEINCLDPAGYGAVTITKSIIIDCEDTQGSILASSVNGVNVNDSASGFPNTIRVTLRGLSINGAGGGAQNAQGNPGSGLVGVNIISGAVVTIEDCIIQNFNSGNASGVRASTNGSLTLNILNSHIVNNSAAGVGGGVFVTPGINGNAKVNIANTQLTNNTNAAVRVDTTGNTGGSGVRVTVDDSVMSNSANGILVNQPAGTASIIVNVASSVISHNTAFGIQASGTGARVRVGGSIISNNNQAAQPLAGAAINTYGNNQNNDNPVGDGILTGTPLS